MMEFLKRKSRWVTSLTIPSLSEEEQSLLGDSIIRNEPLDNCHIVYWVFFLYGVAMLLPWNGK
ncbi:hypothetical protein BC941DRAFT_131948 [Chlamydoabsidia padenii]|nr:hypothetical protein BC941DRAFT_131948 [Chlamydoabsidia padenii]